MKPQEISNHAPSILDAIMGSKTQSSLSSFEPSRVVLHILGLLKERDRQIITNRFGLDNQEVQTLESIGLRHNLTRERVRQIEKDCMATLKQKAPAELKESLQLIFDTIVEHGEIMSEDYLIQMLILNKPGQNEVASVKFLLNLSDQIMHYKEDSEFREAWSVIGFNDAKLKGAISEMINILNAEGKVIPEEKLYEKFKDNEYYATHKLELTDKVLKSYMDMSKLIQLNPFNEIGLKNWSEVKPKDVGDKAYLVLRHNGKPEHYSKITEMINQSKFDDRTAFRETVHNELIKDQRFVLIGRGIYALTEWGYKRGVVADVIREIILKAGEPVSRDRIISEVMKSRLVKRNTILVGLSNKKLFKKVGKDLYTTTETNI
jgi:hypothetical protein